MNNDTINLDITNATDALKVRLSDIWRGFIKFFWIAIALAVLFGGLQFYRSYVRFTPVYTVSATFTVQTENKVLSGDNGVSAYAFYYNRETANQLASVFPYIINNPILTNKVCEELEVKSMPATVTATCIPDTNMVTLTSKGLDPQKTYDALLSVIDNYSSVADYIIGRTKLVIISEPEIPESPSNTGEWVSSVFIAAFAGAAIGAGWIVVYALLRKTIRTKEDIRKVLNQKCIGVLPQVVFKKYRRKINTDIILSNPHIGNDFLESLRLLMNSVHKSLSPEEKILMVTSTAPDEGKSVVTINLASVFAQNNNKVLVVDCDLRDSGIYQLATDNAGIITPKRDNEDYSINHLETLGVDFLSFKDGERALHNIVRTTELQRILSSLRDDYDIIFIDTPPCGIISDAAIIARVSDAVLYIVRQDAILQTIIRTRMSTMLQTETKFLGCILNGATGGIGGYGNYYKYGGYNKYYRYGYRYRGKYGYGYGYSNKKKN